MYIGCKASSEFLSAEYKCNNAFSGKMSDTFTGIWGSNSEGIGNYYYTGAWIEVLFNKDY